MKYREVYNYSELSKEKDIDSKHIPRLFSRNYNEKTGIVFNIYKSNHREKTNVKYVQCIVGDVDEGITLKSFINKVKQLKLQSIIWTSKSHRKKKKGKIADRFHFIFTLSKYYTPEEYQDLILPILLKEFSFADMQVFKDIARKIGFSNGKPIDYYIEGKPFDIIYSNNIVKLEIDNNSLERVSENPSIEDLADYYLYTKNEKQYYELDFYNLKFNTSEGKKLNFEKAKNLLKVSDINLNCNYHDDKKHSAWLTYYKDKYYYHCQVCNIVLKHKNKTDLYADREYNINGKNYMILYQGNKGVYRIYKGNAIKITHIPIRFIKIENMVGISNIQYRFTIEYWDTRSKKYKIEKTFISDGKSELLSAFLDKIGLFKGTLPHRTYMELFPYMKDDAEEIDTYNFEGYKDGEYIFKGINLNTFDIESYLENRYYPKKGIDAINEFIHEFKDNIKILFQKIPAFSLVFLLVFFPFFLRKAKELHLFSTFFNLVFFVNGRSGSGKSWLFELFSNSFYNNYKKINISNSTSNASITLIKDRNYCPLFDDEILRNVDDIASARINLKKALSMIMLEESRGRLDIKGNLKARFPIKGSTFIFFSESNIPYELVGKVEGARKRMYNVNTANEDYLDAKEYEKDSHLYEKAKRYMQENFVYFLILYLKELNKRNEVIKDKFHKLRKQHKNIKYEDIRTYDFYIFVLLLKDMISDIFPDFNKEIIEKRLEKEIIKRMKKSTVINEIIAEILFNIDNYIIFNEPIDNERTREIERGILGEYVNSYNESSKKRYSKVFYHNGKHYITEEAISIWNTNKEKKIGVLLFEEKETTESYTIFIKKKDIEKYIKEKYIENARVIIKEIYNLFKYFKIEYRRKRIFTYGNVACFTIEKALAQKIYLILLNEPLRW